jgi:hypothetical protein
MDVGEGGDTNTGELGAVGIRREIGSSTSTVSSSGMTSSCLDDRLVALPGIKLVYFYHRWGEVIYSYPVYWYMVNVLSSPNLVLVMVVDDHLIRYE